MKKLQVAVGRGEGGMGDLIAYITGLQTADIIVTVTMM